MVFFSRTLFNYRFIIISTVFLCLWHFYTGRQQSFNSKSRYLAKHTPSIFTALIRQETTSSDVVWRLQESWLKRVDSYQFFSPFSAGNESFRLPGGTFSQHYGSLYSWLSYWLASMDVTDIFSFYIYTFDNAYIIVNNLRKELETIDSKIPSYAYLGNCSSSALPTIVLSSAAIKVLANIDAADSKTPETSSLSNCMIRDYPANLCVCLDKLGFKKFNIDIDAEGKKRYLYINRHFSRSEMRLTKNQHGFYWDGKEVFESLSSDIIAFLNVNPLEQTILDTLLYRLNKNEL